MVRTWVIILLICIIVVAGIVVIAAIPDSSDLLYYDQVAIIKVDGIISTQGGSLFFTATTPESINSLLEQANEDPNIKAVVLEINSPGGSPVASDEIANKIKEMDKPVVAWVSDIGTSGAYWVASSSDKIVAHPMSITCSIGVFTEVGEYSELLDEWGLNFTVIKSGEYKDLGSPYRPLEEDEEALLQGMVDQIHQSFVNEVAENRGLSIAEVREIADGRPCTGRDAYEYGLVDVLGNEDDAIDLAEYLAGIENAEITYLKEEPDYFYPYLGITLQRAFYSMGMGIGDSLQGRETLSIRS